MRGFVQDIEGIAVKNRGVPPSALDGEKLPARRHGVKTQGGDWGGSP